MELVRKISFSYVLPKQFKGFILVLEYSYFLLQRSGNAKNTLDLAVKKYQSSGTQATVMNVLQHSCNGPAVCNLALNPTPNLGFIILYFPLLLF